MLPLEKSVFYKTERYSFLRRREIIPKTRYDPEEMLYYVWRLIISKKLPGKKKHETLDAFMKDLCSITSDKFLGWFGDRAWSFLSFVILYLPNSGIEALTPFGSFGMDLLSFISKYTPDHIKRGWLLPVSSTDKVGFSVWKEIIEKHTGPLNSEIWPILMKLDRRKLLFPNLSGITISDEMQMRTKLYTVTKSETFWLFLLNYLIRQCPSDIPMSTRPFLEPQFKKLEHLIAEWISEGCMHPEVFPRCAPWYTLERIIEITRKYRLDKAEYNLKEIKYKINKLNMNIKMELRPRIVIKLEHRHELLAKQMELAKLDIYLIQSEDKIGKNMLGEKWYEKGDDDFEGLLISFD